MTAKAFPGQIGPMGLRPTAQRRTPRSLLLQALPILAALLALWGLQDRMHYPDPGLRIHSLRIIPGPSSPIQLQAEDRLISVNGIAASRDLQARSLMAREGLKGALRLEVEREGQRFEILHPVELLSLPKKAYWALRTLAGLLVLFTAWMVFRRRRDPLAQLFLLLCVLLGSLLVPQPRPLANPWTLLLELESDLLSLLLPPLFLHFIILFPESRPRRKLMLAAIYAPTALWAFIDAFGVLFMENPHELQYRLEQIAGLHAVLLLLISVALLVVKTFRRSRRRERYRIRLVLTGAIIGLFPLLLFQVLHQLFPAQVISAAASAPFFLVFLPISFAYGILIRDLLYLQRRAERAARQLLRGSIFLIIFIGIQALTLKLGPRSETWLGLMGLTALAVALTLLIWLPLARRLPGSGHRNEAEEMPRSRGLLLGQQGFPHLSGLMETVSSPICEDLQSSWALWLVREEDGWRELHRWEDPQSDIEIPHPVLPATPLQMPGRLEKHLLERKEILAAELWDPYWSRSLLGSRAQQFCADRDWSLLISFPEGREALLLVLGPCRVAPLHSPRRLASFQDLLPSLALQIQNLSMVERLAREEVLDRELKVARKIQERILPKEAPQLPGVEILGKTLPGREVGGDYLDFMELGEGRLGLALGDATGMGIPAALLMAGVAQSFRAMASAERPVSEVLEGMNRDMVRSRNDPQFQGFFAAFFYGLLDTRSGLLSFCNAGMPTPWLLRRDGLIERLHRGGPLLGIQESGMFQEGRVRLGPGDLLFIRSDGLEEQEDEEGELFGEDRLYEWMKSNQSWPVQTLGEELLSAVETFAGKASKDDISLILLRLNSS